MFESSGTDLRFERIAQDARQIRVLMYHRVVADAGQARRHWTCVHVERFRKQMRFLDAGGFTPITLKEYRLVCEGRLNLPRKPIIITFDDGYRDTYSLAAPILGELNFRAVVFVLGDRTITTNRWDQSLGIGGAPLMNAEEIVNLSRAGFEIGAHSMTHPRLPLVPFHRAWIEISRPKMLLEILTNSPVVSFSYPYGLANPTVRELTKEAGYSYGCSVYSGASSLAASPFEICRTAVASTTSLVGFAARVLLPFAHFERAKRKAHLSLMQLNHLIRSSSMREDGPAVSSTTRYSRLP